MEDLIMAIGNPGRFQIFIFALISVNLTILLSTHFSMIFYGAKTKHHCKLDIGQNLSDFIPLAAKNKDEELDSCHMFEARNSTNRIPCKNGWSYIMKENERTIISEFDLVCDDSYKVDLSTTIYFTGVTLGGLIFGVIADKFGRKPVIASTLLAAGILNMAIFIFRNYIAFAVFRFFLGLTMQGLQSSGVVLAMELFPTNYRSYIGALCGVTGNIGALCFGLLVYLVKDWRYVQLALSIASFVQIFSLWFIPESIRWYMLHGHFEKAEKVVRRITQANKLEFPEETFEKVKDQSQMALSDVKTKTNGSIFDVYREPSLRKLSIILTIVWMSISITFFGLSLNISFLFGNKYLNYIIGQIIDCAVISSLLWTLPRFGRRKLLLLMLPMSTTALATCAVIAGLNADSRILDMIRTIAALGGKCLSSTCIVIMILYTAELYPTILRNIGFGVAMFWCRLGAMAAPQLFFLGMKTSIVVPYIIAGTLLLVSAILVFFLPETHKQILTERLGHKRNHETNDKPSCLGIDDPLLESRL